MVLSELVKQFLTSQINVLQRILLKETAYLRTFRRSQTDFLENIFVLKQTRLIKCLYVKYRSLFTVSVTLIDLVAGIDIGVFVNISYGSSPNLSTCSHDIFWHKDSCLFSIVSVTQSLALTEKNTTPPYIRRPSAVKGHGPAKARTPHQKAMH